MNWIDLILLCILFLFGLKGYLKGLLRESFSLAGLVIGFMVAVRYDAPMAAAGGFYWSVSPLVLKGAAFVIIFFVVYFLFNLVGWLLHQSQKILFLQTLNRVGGIAVGLVKGAAVTALLTFFVSSAAWIPQSTRERIEGSYLVPPLFRLGEEMIRIGREKLFPKEGGQAHVQSGLRRF